MKLRSIAPPLAAAAIIVITQAGCAGAPSRVGYPEEPSRVGYPEESTPHLVYLMQSGWHTELLFDAPSMLARSAKLRRDFHDNKYLIVGWGDGEYFVTEHPPWTSAVKALVASRYPALQVGSSETNPPPETELQSSIPLSISEHGYQQLVEYIDRSIAEDASGKPIYLGRQQPNLNLFYQATGSYSAFNNCNSWVLGALQAADLPISGGFNLTAQSVFEQASRISAVQRKQQLLPAAR